MSKTITVPITRIADDTRHTLDDVVAIEEPLEISASWQALGEHREKNISVTMRTPGDDFDLALGFLFTEGLIASGEDVESVRHWGSSNRVRVGLMPHARIDASKLDRHFYTTSSCGVCGKTSVDALRVNLTPLQRRAPVEGSIVRAFPAALHQDQAAFHSTGGVHGAAILAADGTVLRSREDVGRHNAVDKVIGSFVGEKTLPPEDAMLVVSSRGSFEIVQKAIVARISAVAFIGGPSSLAVDLAREFNVTLLGFVREGRFNVYSGEVV